MRFLSRFFTLVLMVAPVAFAADPAPAPPSALTPAQAEAVKTVIHDYLLANPKLLLEVLDRAEAANKEAEESQRKERIEANRAALEHSPADPVRGNPQAPVTLVEFFDYRCPYCRRTAEAVHALIDHHPEVRLVLKELPVLGPASTFAARAALVAARHGHYLAFHDAMWALKGAPTEEETMAVVKAIGMDPAKVKVEMESDGIDQQLAANAALATTLGIDGTPAFFAGTTLIPGAIGLEDMEKLIAAAKG